MKTIKIIEELKKTKKYQIALMTTFNFDIDFFERSILNILYDNGTNDISLFVDSKELNKALINTTKERIDLGEKYMIYPVEMKGAFHPKIILLLGVDSARLFVLSANITQSGYSFNNEIFNDFLYDKKNSQNLNIINLAIAFFKQLYKSSPLKCDDLITKIDKYDYVGKFFENDDLFLLHNQNESIIEQLNKIIKDAIEIKIAVPFYDNELSGLTKLHEAFPNAKINLYIQQSKSKFPIARKNDFVNIFVFDKICQNKRFYHGKVFLFKTQDKSYIMYGSANCTQSAIVKYGADNGNIECVVVERGEKDEFDEFFGEFIKADSQVLNCGILEYKTEDNSNFFFKYGIVEENGINIYLGFKRKENDYDILIDGKKVCYKEINECVEVFIPINDVNIANPFDVYVHYGNKDERIKAWAINLYALNNNRTYTSTKYSEDCLKKYEIDSDNSEKYLEDQKFIITQLSLSKNEIESEQFAKRQATQLLIENLEDDLNYENKEELEKNVVVDYTPPQLIYDEYQNKQFVYEKLKKINLFEYYLNGFRFCDNKKSENTTERSLYSENRVETSTKKERKATSKEKRFKTFIRKRLDDLYSAKLEEDERVSFEQYFTIVMLFINVFNKYTVKEKVIDLFDKVFIAQEEYNLVSRLIKKQIPDDEDMKEAVIRLSINSVIANHDAKVYETKNKQWLKEINRTFSIRDNYQLYLEKINSYLKDYNQGFNVVDYCRYFEETFGDLTFGKLEEFINNSFIEWEQVDGVLQPKQPTPQVTISNQELQNKKKVLNVVVKKVDLGKYFKVDSIKNIFDKTKKYNACSITKYDILRIIIKDRLSDDNFIQYDIDMYYGKWTLYRGSETTLQKLRDGYIK